MLTVQTVISLKRKVDFYCPDFLRLDQLAGQLLILPGTWKTPQVVFFSFCLPSINVMVFTLRAFFNGTRREAPEDGRRDSSKGHR